MHQAINNLLRDSLWNLVATEAARLQGEDLKDFLDVRRRNIERLLQALAGEPTAGRIFLRSVLKELHDFTEEALAGGATAEDLLKFEELIDGIED
jgi:hypothetical protein